MTTVEKYFAELSDKQKKQFHILEETCREWNDKINIISRKDIDNIEINHILHSLAIGKFIKFQPHTKIIDLGTGGGFPGIPLAILFPDSQFHLIDRIGKKIKVAKAIADACGLENISFQHGDFSECKEDADFIVSRAVMPQNELVKIVRRNVRKESHNALPNGLITLKGGDLSKELIGIEKMTEEVGIDNYFEEPFFKTKKIIYSQI